MRNEISECNRHNEIIVRNHNSLLSHYSECLPILSSISFITHNFESQYEHLGIVSKHRNYVRYLFQTVQNYIPFGTIVIVTLRKRA